MTHSLPADPPHARRLTGVLPQLIASLDGRPGWFPQVSSAVLFLVDGLGARNLSARAGHARFLAAHATKKAVARTVFPSTTATALTSLLTATEAGEHGIVGYSALSPGAEGESGTIVNQLRGWDRLDPLTWQRSRPLLESEGAAGRPVFVVSKADYIGTGFTEAILRGAPLIAAPTALERAEIAADLARGHPGALIYLYANDLDATGHKHGWESDRWVSALETVDAAARRLAEALPARAGALVTADHGMVDVPRHRHVLLGEDDTLLDGVQLIGGEPRMLHLYTEPGAAASVLERWRDAESHRSWVLSRDQAIEAGVFGPVAPDVRDRIGDVLVAARAAIAYYDDRVDDKASQRMIGQHGSLTDEERIVPLLRLGGLA